MRNRELWMCRSLPGFRRPVRQLHRTPAFGDLYSEPSVARGADKKQRAKEPEGGEDGHSSRVKALPRDNREGGGRGPASRGG